MSIGKKHTVLQTLKLHKKEIEDLQKLVIMLYDKMKELEKKIT